MGFFQDLKEDLSLAVNELLPEEEVKTEEITEADATVNETLKEVEAALAAEIAPEEIVGEQIVEAAATAEAEDENEAELDKELQDALLSQLSDTSQPVKEAAAAQFADIASIATMAEPKVEQTPSLEQIAQETAQVVEETPVLETPETMPEIPQEVMKVPVEETVSAVMKESELEERDEQTPEQLLGDMAGMTMPQTETEADKTERKADVTMENTLTASEVLDETAVITKGMSITGDITSQGSLEILGKVVGNIQVLGKLNVTGNLEGDSKAAEIFADAAHIVGKIDAQGTVKIGKDSVIIGDITASSAVIAGAVKGDIDVHGPVILDATAVIMGNIKSKSVQINNGAVIEGMCSQCYAERSAASYFE